MEKMAWDGPKWGREDFFLTNPDLANILGRTDLDFEDFYFFHFFDPKFLDFQVPRFPDQGKKKTATFVQLLGNRLWKPFLQTINTK